MNLKYPLSHYDEAGRLKPSFLSYGFLLFACRGLIVLIVAISLRQDGDRLLRVFYPETYHFYLSLLPIVPALLSLALLSKRASIIKSGRTKWFDLIIPVSCSAFIIDIIVQSYILNQINFVFSPTHGVSILIASTGLLFWLRGNRVRDMLVDWKK